MDRQGAGGRFDRRELGYVDMADEIVTAPLSVRPPATKRPKLDRRLVPVGAAYPRHDFLITGPTEDVAKAAAEAALAAQAGGGTEAAFVAAGVAAGVVAGNIDPAQPLHPFADIQPNGKHDADKADKRLWPLLYREDTIDPQPEAPAEKLSAVLLADQFARYAVSRFEGAYVSDYGIQDEAKWQLQTCWIPNQGAHIVPVTPVRIRKLINDTKIAHPGLIDYIDNNAKDIFKCDDLLAIEFYSKINGQYSKWKTDLAGAFPSTKKYARENGAAAVQRECHNAVLFQFAVHRLTQTTLGVPYLLQTIHEACTALDNTEIRIPAPDRRKFLAVFMVGFDLLGQDDTSYFFPFDNDDTSIYECFEAGATPANEYKSLQAVARLLKCTLEHAATQHPQTGGAIACPMAQTIQTHLKSVNAVRLVENTFYQQCTKLQRDEITVGGAKTNLSDFPLFKPVRFYAKGPSVHQIATVCRLDGWGIKTAAFDRAEALINHAIRHFFDMRSKQYPQTLADRYTDMTKRYVATTQSALPDLKKYDTVSETFMHQYVSAFRLATRVLRGTRAQISDMHARTLSKIEFDAAIDALCDDFI